MERAKRIIKSNPFILTLLLLLVIVVFGVQNNKFLVVSNLVQYLNSGVVLGFLTFGLAATIITGNFDYSIGSMCGFGTVLLSQFITMSIPLVFTLALTAIILACFGMFNGFLVGYLRIPGMLATLGTSSLYYGIGLIFTGGQAISVMGLPGASAFEFFGKSDMGTLPFGMVMLAIVFAASAVLLKSTCWGRRIYLIGENVDAARFAGINYKRDILLAHVYSAIMCFFGAVVLGSRMASGRADVGSPYVLEAVSAAVFGGISIKGGEGTLAGALLGVLIFSVMTSGFTMINLSQYYRQVVTGALLIIVLVIRNYKTIFARA